MRRVRVLVSFLVLLVSPSHGWTDHHPDFTHMLVYGWTVEDGQVEWRGTHTEGETQALVDHFWRLQAAAQRHGVMVPFLKWLPVFPPKALLLGAMDPPHRTLLCTSELPLGVSAQRFLTALGCEMSRS